MKPIVKAILILAALGGCGPSPEGGSVTKAPKETGKEESEKAKRCPVEKIASQYFIKHEAVFGKVDASAKIYTGCLEKTCSVQLNKGREYTHKLYIISSLPANGASEIQLASLFFDESKCKVVGHGVNKLEESVSDTKCDYTHIVEEAQHHPHEKPSRLGLVGLRDSYLIFGDRLKGALSSNYGNNVEEFFSVHKNSDGKYFASLHVIETKKCSWQATTQVPLESVEHKVAAKGEDKAEDEPAISASPTPTVTPSPTPIEIFRNL